MPPKTRISKEMIISAAVELIRESGFESVNARAVASRLNCSTQPVLYHFDTIESLKRAAYAQINHLHSEYLMQTSADEDPILSIGLNYIRFAVKEPQLFRFLFQSGYAQESSLLDVIDCDEIRPILESMQEGAGLNMEQTKRVFMTVALFTHGYASMIANHALEYDEKAIALQLEQTWDSMVLAAVQERVEHT